MNNKEVYNKFRWVALICAVLFSNASADELVLTMYGGLGNIVSADTVTSKVFRSFRAWNSFIDINIFPDTRTLPEMPDFSNWKNDSSYFENSIAVAFEGNRIARIVNVTFSEEKIIVKYNLSEDEYTITDYQHNPQGNEIRATAIVFYFISSESIDLSEKEVVFLLNNVSVKTPRQANPFHSVQDQVFKIKKVDMSGRLLFESNTSGIYIMKSARHNLRKIVIK